MLPELIPVIPPLGEGECRIPAPAPTPVPIPAPEPELELNPDPEERGCLGNDPAKPEPEPKAATMPPEAD